MNSQLTTHPEDQPDLMLLLQQAEQIVADENDFIANAANLSSLLYHQISQLNWVGFYFRKGEELVLGPFQGQLACTRIGLGKGVCGTAFKQKKSLMVNDVLSFDGHIACDAASRSEVVVPFYSKALSGVLDIDSPIENRFDFELLRFFEQIVSIYHTKLG